jgi:Transglycosylase SLT domain
MENPPRICAQTDLLCTAQSTNPLPGKAPAMMAWRLQWHGVCNGGGMTDARPRAGIYLRITLCVVLSLAAIPAAARTNIDAQRVCATAAAGAERARRLPPMLLHAVALAESARWDAKRRASLAWPWTVTSGGKGRYFPTKQAAIDHVRRLQARGVRNIDVGCMQINLRHHPDAFTDLDQAFDPAANAAYAADFLVRLRTANRSWSRAVAQYHSSTPSLGRPYWKRVYAIWSTERRKAYEAYRQRRIARLLARR